MQDHSERYCNVLPVFGFHDAKYNNNLKKSYLLLLLVSERGVEPMVIRKANQFVSFKFWDVLLPDILIFLRKATIFDSFLILYKISETKIFLPYEWFVDPKKLNDAQLRP